MIIIVIIAASIGRRTERITVLKSQGVLNVVRRILIVETVSKDRREYNYLHNQLGHVNDDYL